MSVRRPMVCLLSLTFALAACAGSTAPEAPETTSETAGGSTLEVIDIANAMMIEDGVLGGGQPDEAQLRRAAEAGYRTIVNTRGSTEMGDFAAEEELVRSLGMDYVFLPIGEGEPVDEAKARKLAEILDGPDARPAMVHCRSGNRVGVLYAAKAFFVDGLDPDRALEYGTASGMRRVPDELPALLKGAQDD